MIQNKFPWPESEQIETAVAEMIANENRTNPMLWVMLAIPIVVAVMLAMRKKAADPQPAL